MAKVSGKDGSIFIGSSDSIEGVTNNTGDIDIDLTGHSFTANMIVEISGVVGMTDLNGIFVVNSIETNSINVTLTTVQEYTSGGTVIQTIPVTDWELDAEEDVVDTTDSGNAGWATAEAKGITKFSGRMTGFIYDGGQKPVAGDSQTVLLYIDGDSYFSGTGIINRRGIRVSIPGTEFVKQEYEFQGSGTLS
jgi:hypothetical protein